MMERYLLHVLLLLLLFSSLSLVFAENHSHFFFTTITNDSTYDYPSYCTTRSLDGVTLYWYDSDIGVIERRVPWFKSTSGNLLDATISEYKFQRTLQSRFEEYRNYMNDTEGLQVLQLLDGCTLYDDGTTDAIFSFHYNGNPFIRFSIEDSKWIADDPRAQIFADKNNKKNKTALEEESKSMANACVPHILELLSLGSCMFNRKEAPAVQMTQTPITNSTSRLNCRAYGHYPKNISMAFYKNGEPVPESVMEQVTLPLPDVTWLTWLWMNITPMVDDVYACRVTHSSMTSPAITYMGLSKDSSDLSTDISDHKIDGGQGGLSNGGLIGICVAAIVVVLAVVFTSMWLVNTKEKSNLSH